MIGLSYDLPFLRKENIKTNPESQILEDVVCLVFLKHYLIDFIKNNNHLDEEKLLNIIRKTWKKMSPQGQQFALTLPMTAQDLTIIQESLSL